MLRILGVHPSNSVSVPQLGIQLCLLLSEVFGDDGFGDRQPFISVSHDLET